MLADNAVAVFHIGSTSVPGLRAKPIIDILPVVRDIGRVDVCRARFETIGYTAMGEYGIPGRRFFYKGGDSRTHHIHAFQYDTAYDIARHVAFRDYLRIHADVREEYGACKAALARRFPEDIEAYCDGKDALVKRMERDALQWYWAKQAT